MFGASDWGPLKTKSERSGRPEWARRAVDPCGFEFITAENHRITASMCVHRGLGADVERTLISRVPSVVLGLCLQGSLTKSRVCDRAGKFRVGRRD